MIHSLLLESFKCFRRLRLPLSPLTILTGFNAGGKSSALQALLLLHQWFSDRRQGLRLSGSLVHLGAFSDVVDKLYGSQTFSIGIRDDIGDCEWTFESSDPRELVATIARVLSAGGDFDHPKRPAEDFRSTHKSTYKQLQALLYVPADRQGPLEVHPLEPRRRQLTRANTTLGIRGEYSVSRLLWSMDDEIDEGMRHPSEQLRAQVRHQLHAWMREIFPGVELDLQPVKGANLVTLGIRTSQDTDFHRPQNVGFGISYALPVFVALLTARPGDLILIENPEAHLHPKGQSDLAKVIAHAVRAGRQVIVETHSDHIINGVRKAVAESIVKPDDVAIHFFRSRAEYPDSQVVTVNLDAKGGIDHWPDGFFDQIDKDLMALLGVEG